MFKKPLKANNPSAHKNDGIQLIKRYQEEKDPVRKKEIRNRAIIALLPLIIKTAHEIASKTVFHGDVEDLIHEGVIAMTKAIEVCNPDEREGIVVWYLKKYISTSMFKFIRKYYYPIRIPRKVMHKKKGEVLSDFVFLNEVLLREDTDISKQLPDENPTPEEEMTDIEARNILNLVLLEVETKLRPKEMFILRERIMSPNPKKLREIAQKFNVSHERVRQMEKHIIRILKKIVKRTMKEQNILHEPSRKK